MDQSARLSDCFGCRGRVLLGPHVLLNTTLSTVTGPPAKTIRYNKIYSMKRPLKTPCNTLKNYIRPSETPAHSFVFCLCSYVSFILYV